MAITLINLLGNILGLYYNLEKPTCTAYIDNFANGLVSLLMIIDKLSLSLDSKSIEKVVFDDIKEIEAIKEKSFSSFVSVNIYIFLY